MLTTSATLTPFSSRGGLSRRSGPSYFPCLSAMSIFLVGVDQSSHSALIVAAFDTDEPSVVAAPAVSPDDTYPLA